VPAEPLERTGREVGLDLGIVNLLATSEGELVDADRFARRSCDHLAVAQRSLDRETRVESSSAAGARGCSTAPQGSQSASERPPQLSRRLVNQFDLIAIEDLKIKNMVRSPKPRPDPSNPEVFLPNGAAAKAGLNRSISDAGGQYCCQ